MKRIYRSLMMLLGPLSWLQADAYDTDPEIVYPRYPHESPGQAEHPGIFENLYYDRFTSFEEKLARPGSENEPDEPKK